MPHHERWQHDPHFTGRSAPLTYSDFQVYCLRGKGEKEQGTELVHFTRKIYANKMRCAVRCAATSDARAPRSATRCAQRGASQCNAVRACKHHPPIHDVQAPFTHGQQTVHRAHGFFDGGRPTCGRHEVPYTTRGHRLVHAIRGHPPELTNHLL